MIPLGLMDVPRRASKPRAARRLRGAVLICLALLLGACAGPPPAPVEDRSNSSAYRSTPDDHYRVRRGDSLYAISFRYGVDWRSLAAWNNIAAPYTIYPDQLLRVSPPGQPARGGSSSGGTGQASTGVQTAPAREPDASTRSLETPRATTVDTAAAEMPAATPADTPMATSSENPGSAAGTTPYPTEPSVESPAAARTLPPNASQAPAGSTYTVPRGDPDRWLWPTEGRVISRFAANDPARKGIDIAGRPGQAVVAAADGQVVYSGSGLIGYGELVIIKHSDRMLSAYAHNRNRLVSEGQVVAAGSTIAEMGTNDRNQPLLHFEIRVNGTPQDPMRFLPSQ